MNRKLQGTLKIKKIIDSKQTKKEKNKEYTVEIRKVVMENDEKTFKITLTNDLASHQLRTLNIGDLMSEVEVELDLFLGSRQKRIDEVTDE